MTTWQHLWRAFGDGTTVVFCFAVICCAALSLHLFVLRPAWRLWLRFRRMGRPVGPRPESDPFRLSPDDYVDFELMKLSYRKTAPRKGTP